MKLLKFGGVGLRSVAVPSPLIPAVVVADAMAWLFDGVGRRGAVPTLRAVPCENVVVPVYIEVVGHLHEGQAFVEPLGEAALATPQLHPSPVEPYVAVFVLRQAVSVVAVHKLLFEETVGLPLRLESCLRTKQIEFS